MELRRLLRQIDAETARAFVSATHHVLDAVLLEMACSEEVRTPGARDYGSATLDRSAPIGGWISHEELRQVTRQMSEALAAEKWAEGVALAIRLLTICAGA